MLAYLLAAILTAEVPADRCSADIARAEASAFEASRAQHACMDPAECRVADEFVRAAQAQLAAVRQLCGVPAPVVPAPDPFEGEAPADEGDAEAWLLMDALVSDVTERLEAVTRP